MNVFDIIGPVMIGPSSSHTAGAVRLGRVANKLTDNRPLKRVEITLSGSFAQTYKGHGTDRALLAGIMGYHSYSAEIRDALTIAKERGIDYEFIKEDIKGAHPNTARIHFLVMHQDKPGVIAAVTQLMHFEYEDLNIATFHLTRESRGGNAIMTIEIDGQPPEALIGAIREIQFVTNAILIRRI